MTIAARPAAGGKRLTAAGLGVRTVASRGLGESKLVVNGADAQVKVEANAVFRGTVLQPERRPLVRRAAATFAAELELPVLAADELCGSKLVAAMDRQHPRDLLFDVWEG
jgi:hypothetical protein